MIVDLVKYSLDVTPEVQMQNNKAGATAQTPPKEGTATVLPQQPL